MASTRLAPFSPIPLPPKNKKAPSPSLFGRMFLLLRTGFCDHGLRPRNHDSTANRRDGATLQFIVSKGRERSLGSQSLRSRAHPQIPRISPIGPKCTGQEAAATELWGPLKYLEKTSRGSEGGTSAPVPEDENTVPSPASKDQAGPGLSLLKAAQVGIGSLWFTRRAQQAAVGVPGPGCRPCAPPIRSNPSPHFLLGISPASSLPEA